MADTAQGNRRATTSLAVWDISSPVVAGEQFAVKVGVKSSADCDLRGRAVEVYDATGTAIGEGRLGDTPWPGTQALYWAELPLPAPTTDGIATLSARFRANGLQPPHTDATATFSIAVARAPEHTLTIKVVVPETATPLKDAALRLGPYRAVTDGSGAATLRVSKGDFELRVWKIGFDAPPTAVSIAGDATVEVEAVIVPEENVDRAWKM